jgi:tetratricopeptide (TPR) repeat protein
MSVTLLLAIALAITVIALVAYMLAQKPVTTAQKLIHEHRYEEAAALPATDSAGHLHRAEALKLLGRFEDSIVEYRQSDDPAAREGVALALAHLRRDLDEAKSTMEQTVAAYPAIQEFQALGLAYILLRRGEREAALRLYRDNVELLETRFRDDYTDADPLLAETLVMYGELARAAGEMERAEELEGRAATWAPRSVWAHTVFHLPTVPPPPARP